MRLLAIAPAIVALLTACGGGSEPATKTPSPTPAEPGGPSATVACDADNGGITLPAGFCATTFADHVGTARHIAVTSSGDVYVMLSAGAILALRDTNADGHSDVRATFG